MAALQTVVVGPVYSFHATLWTPDDATSDDRIELISCRQQKRIKKASTIFSLISEHYWYYRRIRINVLANFLRLEHVLKNLLRLRSAHSHKDRTILNVSRRV